MSEAGNSCSIAPSKDLMSHRSSLVGSAKVVEYTDVGLLSISLSRQKLGQSLIELIQQAKNFAPRVNLFSSDKGVVKVNSFGSQ